MTFNPALDPYPFNDAPNGGNAASTTNCFDLSVSSYKNIVAVTDNALTGKVHIFPFTSLTGFGTKYISPSITDTCGILSFNPTASALVFGSNAAPFINAYPVTTAWGTKYGNPASLPSQKTAPTFAPNGNSIVFMDGTNVCAYPWSAGFGTKISAASGISAGATTDIATISPDSNTVVMGISVTPYVKAIPFTGSAFGTVYSNPATLPTTTLSGKKLRFNPAGTVVLVPSNSGLLAYAWSGAGWGTKYSSDTVSAYINAAGVSFNATGTRIAMTHVNDSTNSLGVWDWNNGFGTLRRNANQYYVGNQLEFPYI